MYTNKAVQRLTWESTAVVVLPVPPLKFRIAIFRILIAIPPTGDIPLDRNNPKEHFLYYKI